MFPDSIFTIYDKLSKNDLELIKNYCKNELNLYVDKFNNNPFVKKTYIEFLSDEILTIVELFIRFWK